MKDQLPSKEEHVILVRLSPLQRALYTEFMNRFREAGNTGWLSLNPLKAFCVCCKVRSASVCLDLFRNFVSLVTIMTFIYSFSKYKFALFFRFGTIQMSCTRLCRRKTWQATRI